MITYADIVLVVIAALAVFVGYRRGFLVSILNILQMVVGLPVSFYISNTCNEYFYDNFIRSSVTDSLRDKLAESGSLDSFLSNIRETADSMPSFITEKFDLSAVNGLSTEKTVEFIERNIFRPIGIIIVQIVLFLVVFSVIMLVTGIIISLIKHRSRRDDSAFGRTDRLLGAVFGAIKALVLVFVLCTIAGLLTGVLPADDFVRQLEDSKIITLVNKFNPILN